MTCYNPGCIGNYDFDNIVLFAQKRFVDGYSTIELMEMANSDREKEEIALVAILDLNDKTITDLELNCKPADVFKVTNCRNLLKQIIQEGLATKN